MAKKSVFWFMPALKGAVRGIFLETPLRTDINFQIFLSFGFDAVGVIVENSSSSEQNVINLLKNFGARAKSFKIPKVFVLDVGTLSLTTSTVCAGFDFLGGAATHEEVAHPDTVHKFRHEDLLAGLIEINAQDKT